MAEKITRETLKLNTPSIVVTKEPTVEVLTKKGRADFYQERLAEMKNLQDFITKEFDAEIKETEATINHNIAEAINTLAKNTGYHRTDISVQVTHGLSRTRPGEREYTAAVSIVTAQDENPTEDE